MKLKKISCNDRTIEREFHWFNEHTVEAVIALFRKRASKAKKSGLETN